MGKINQHIEIVSSTVPSLSSMSKVSRQAVKAALSRYYRRVGITTVDNLSDLNALVAKAPDLVFLAMKFVPEDASLGINSPRKVWLAEHLAEHGIATTGSPSLAHKVELNKSFAKKCLLYDGLSTSNYFVAKNSQQLLGELLPGEFPLFVKPANRGGGIGIGSDSVVRSLEQLKSKVDSITKDLGSSALIEKYLPGREFSVAILKFEETGEYAALPLELVAPETVSGVRILGGETKSSNSEQVKLVPGGELKDSVVDLAMSAFRSIGGRDYGRIDIRLDENNVPHFLEANLIPSLIDNYGSFPKACKLGFGIDYEEMLLRIVNLGMARVAEPVRLRAPMSLGALSRPSVAS